MKTDSSGSKEKNHSCDRNKQRLASLMAEFDIEFPSTEACLDELFRLAKIEIQCRFCHSRDLQMSRGSRVGKCRACKKKPWLTAGTILDHIRAPRARLAAIWLTMKGAVLNSVAFSRLLKIAQSSALGILEWVRFTMQDLFPTDAPLVHSSLFTAVFWKRSLETPARERPVAEQDEMERMTPADENSIPASESQDVCNNSIDFLLDFTAIDKQIPDGQPKTSNDLSGEGTISPWASSDPQQQLVFDLLSDIPLQFGALLGRAKIPVSSLFAVLTVLEIEGKVERLDGDWFVRRKPKTRTNQPTRETSKVIESFLKFIRVNFRGISRKYLQSYLAAFWSHTDRSHWSREATWQTCLASRPVSYRHTREYVTPLWVTLLPAS